jgi:Spy/CpxP family protein refolding chaperone
MSNHDPMRDMPAPAPRSRRRKGAYIAVAVVGVTLFGIFLSSSLSQGLRHRLLVSIPDMAAAAAPFDGFGPPFGGDWRNGLFNGAIEAIVEAHADRMIRHLAIEIDATSEQQDKLRTIVQGAVKDLLPVREKFMAARNTARDLLTQQTIDRAAIEKLRADQIAIHDAASKRLVQAVADAADVLTADQRRRISTMLPPRRGPFGHGPFGNWGGFGRN